MDTVFERKCVIKQKFIERLEFFIEKTYNRNRIYNVSQKSGGIAYVIIRRDT